MDDADGLRTAEIKGCSIEAIAFISAHFKQAIQSVPAKLARTGVYILFGEDNEQNAIAYIGEPDDVGKRLSHYVSTEVTKGLISVSPTVNPKAK